MKYKSRLICVLVSFVPYFVVSLALSRLDRLFLVLANLLNAGRLFNPFSLFVIDSMRYWPYLLWLCWALLIPAMFNTPWCSKLRRALPWSYIAVAGILYLVTVEALHYPTIRLAEALANTTERPDNKPVEGDK
jgi:hypothetical protein